MGKAHTNGNVKKDSAYHELKRKIIDFSFSPGTVLTEEFLAEALKISRTPIRDAILKLENEGLVTRESRGVVVRKFTPDDILDTYILREALEICAVQLCVEKASDEELLAIKQDVDSYSTIDAQKESFSEINERFIDFHVRIVDASKNDLLSSVYQNIVDRIRIINRMHMNESFSIEDVRVRHESIINAIIERNAFLAQALINSSIRRIIKALSVPE